jgi:hypothetical protein
MIFGLSILVLVFTAVNRPTQLCFPAAVPAGVYRGKPGESERLA